MLIFNFPNYHVSVVTIYYCGGGYWLITHRDIKHDMCYKTQKMGVIGELGKGIL